MGTSFFGSNPSDYTQIDPTTVAHYRDEAAASATASEASRQASVTSAASASSSAIAAATSETNAATSEADAAASATAAAASDADATTQATTATTQAGIATTQAGNASTSAAAALVSEGNAGTSETNAASSASSASTSASNAATSETNAAASASAAATSASNAASAVQAAAGTATPLVNGTAAVGTGAKWAREDHKHPTDTTRAPTASPAFTGTVALSSSNAGLEMGAYTAVNTPFIDFHSSGNSTDFDVRLIASGGTTSAGAGTLAIVAGAATAPTPSAGDNSTKIATTAFVQSAVSASGASRARLAWQTNRFKYGSFIRGPEGWGVSLNTSEQSVFGQDFDSTNSMLQYFSRAKVQLNANSSGKFLYVGPSKPFVVDLTKRYRAGFTAYGYGAASPLPSVILVKCYDGNGALLSTLTINVNVALTSDPIASQYRAVISANGGAAPAWPTGTVSASVAFGFSSTGSQGLQIMSAYMISEDEWPGSFSSTIVNYGGGTHEAASDGTYLYVVGHGCNEVTKFDGNLQRIASVSVDDYPHCAVVVGADLWVCTQDSASLQRIPLSTFTVANTYAITGAKAGFGLATDGTNLWLGAGTHVQGSAIYSVNTSTGALTLLSTDVDTGAANIPVEYSSGSVWSINEGNSQVKRINPSGGATIATISCSIGTIYGLGVGGGYVFANGQAGIAQIDPATNTVVKTYLLRELIRGTSNICVVGGRAYACGNVGVAVIDYTAQTFEEIVLDGGTPKWARALPSGRVAVGTYAAPWLHVLELG